MVEVDGVQQGLLPGCEWVSSPEDWGTVGDDDLLGGSVRPPGNLEPVEPSALFRSVFGFEVERRSVGNNNLQELRAEEAVQVVFADSNMNGLLAEAKGHLRTVFNYILEQYGAEDGVLGAVATSYLEELWVGAKEHLDTMGDSNWNANLMEESCSPFHLRQTPEDEEDTRAMIRETNAIQAQLAGVKSRMTLLKEEEQRMEIKIQKQDLEKREVKLRLEEVARQEAARKEVSEKDRCLMERQKFLNDEFERQTAVIDKLDDEMLKMIREIKLEDILAAELAMKEEELEEEEAKLEVEETKCERAKDDNFATKIRDLEKIALLQRDINTVEENIRQVAELEIWAKEQFETNNVVPEVESILAKMSVLMELQMPTVNYRMDEMNM